MKSIACVLILVVLCGSPAFGAIMRGVYNDPRYPGKCTIRDDFILSPGEVATDHEDCTRVTCGGDGMVEFATCGLFVVHGCELGDYIDKTLSYPKCCERHIICPE